MLPWRVGFAALKAIARAGYGFASESEAAWRVAAPYAGALGEREWKYRFRLLRWVERTDTYLVLLRGPSWWTRRVRVRGELPPATTARILLTYHWGAGHWIWKLLRAQGVRAHFLARKPTLHDFGVARVAAWYAKLRTWSFARVGSLGPLYTGGSRARVLEALARGESVVAMLDLPAHGGRTARTVSLLGRPVALPAGVAQIAESAQVPVALFSCALAPDGTRELWIEPAEAASADGLMTEYARHLDVRLREAPDAWHMWHEAASAFGESQPRT